MKVYNQLMSTCDHLNLNGSFSQFPEPISCPSCQRELDTLLASENSEPEDSITGRSAPTSSPNKLSHLYEDSLEAEPMSNPQGLPPQETMCGKKTPELKAPNLNSAMFLPAAIHKLTGNLYGQVPRPVKSQLFLRSFVFVITEVSERSRATMRRHLGWFVIAHSTGVELEQVRLFNCR